MTDQAPSEAAERADNGARLVPISSLYSTTWNPRKIDPKEFQRLVASMQEDPDFLRMRPILAMADGAIYAGDKRWGAARTLGYDRVWAIVEDVDTQLAFERNLRDNTHNGIFDDEKLEKMVRELRDMGSRVDLLGLPDKQLESLLKSEDQLPPAGDQQTEETPQMWGVIVTLSDEAQQVELLQRLSDEGYAVRPLMS